MKTALAPLNRAKSSLGALLSIFFLPIKSGCEFAEYPLIFPIK